MKEKNRHNLLKAISELPVFHSEKMRFDSLFDGKDTGSRNDILPKYPAPDGLWNRIEENLDKHNSVPVNKKRPMTRLAAAVILVLAIGAGLTFLKRYIDSGSVKVAENIAEADSPADTGILTIYNPALCNNNPGICRSPLFRELEKQLQEVKHELTLLEPLVQQNDPQMLKYYYRLGNLKIDIEKRMVKMITQS